MQKRLFVVGVLGVTATLLNLLINSMPTPAKAAGMNNPPDHTNLYSFSFNNTGLLSACFTPILQYGDFEGPLSEVSSVWQKSDSADFSDVSYQSNRGIALPASAGHEPSIYQTFELPMGLSPDTSVVLQLKKGVDLKGGSSNPEDKLYFVLRRDSDGAEIIPSVLLADGQDRTTEIPPIPDLDPNIHSPDQWTEFNQDILSGVNPFYFLEAGDTVQAYFYVSDPGVDTSFFLDNISLTFCTAPLPPPEAIYLPIIFSATSKPFMARTIPHSAGQSGLFSSMSF